MLLAPISCRVLSTTSICSSKPGCEMSTTCRSMSASRTSSSVLLKASTSCVGSFLMNPTVSLRRNGTFSITTFLTVVSRVAKSLFSAKTSDLASRFIIVLLPTLVYPTRESRTIEPLLPLCVAICLSTFFNCSFSLAILSLTIRRSISIWVSPIPPLVPIPPLCLSRWVHIPASLGSI